MNSKKLIKLESDNKQNIIGLTNLKQPYNISSLYKKRNRIKETQLAYCGPLDHTMFYSLDEYVRQKFPVEYFCKAIINNWDIEIQGVYSQHFQKIYKKLNYQKIEKIFYKPNSRTKLFNTIRPQFYVATNDKGKKALVCTVIPGRDYVLHYASMARHLICMLTKQSKVSLKGIRYPEAEQAVHLWTELNEKFVKKDDLLIIGYVEEVNNIIKNSRDFIFYACEENDYYKSIRYKLPSGKFLNLFGVKFSFWGCISAKIVGQICALGAKEIIYVGKLGALTSPKDLYRKIFVPSNFVILYHDKLVAKITNLPNNFLSQYKYLDSFCHVSVPTVLEEDYIQRDITIKEGVASIDNEISQIALAVFNYNLENSKRISFSSIHFATDYIRKKGEQNLVVNFDLSNNRSEKAKKRKNEILSEISQLLKNYLKYK